MEKLSPREIDFVKKLVPYSTRTPRIQSIKALNKVNSQIIFVEQNSQFLSYEESQGIKNEEWQTKASYRDSLLPALGFSGLAFGWYVLNTPVNRNMYKEVGKSIGVGVGVSCMYQMYCYWNYKRRLQEIFDLVIYRKTEMLSNR